MNRPMDPTELERLVRATIPPADLFLVGEPALLELLRAARAGDGDAILLAAVQYGRSVALGFSAPPLHLPPYRQVPHPKDGLPAGARVLWNEGSDTTHAAMHGDTRTVCERIAHSMSDAPDRDTPITCADCYHRLELFAGPRGALVRTIAAALELERHPICEPQPYVPSPRGYVQCGPVVLRPAPERYALVMHQAGLGIGGFELRGVAFDARAVHRRVLELL